MEGILQRRRFFDSFNHRSLVEAIQGQHFELKKCVYPPDKQEKVINSLIDSKVKPYAERPEQFSEVPCTPDMLSGKAHNSTGEFLWELYSICSTLKHPSFEREEKWRLVYDHKRPFNEIKPKFRAKNGLIIPYTSINLPKSEEFWRQVEIIIGPTKYKKELEGSVYTLFRQSDKTARIMQSEIPYREL